jgi:DNA-binding Xre family transcriptional regulator
MLKKGVKFNDLVTDTGLDKTNISAWVNGKRDMSQIVKAMFYFYFTR